MVLHTTFLGVIPLNSVCTYICHHFTRFIVVLAAQQIPGVRFSRCWWKKERREILFVVLHPICFPATWRFNLSRPWLFQSSEAWNSSLYPVFFYIELHIFSSSSRAGWNILEVSLFFSVIFVDSRNQMKRVSSFHKEVFRIF